MQRSLFLLVLISQCFVSTCHLYVYHFINKNASWDDARCYCREKHTDLAAVYDMTDVDRLSGCVTTGGEAWIGLYSVSREKNRRWFWSLPGVEYEKDDDDWADGEPEDEEDTIKNCVKMSNGKWIDDLCDIRIPFICVNGTKQTNVNKDQMNWLEAQSYCREHHTDLMSGHKRHRCQQPEDDDLDDPAAKNDAWIGLFRDWWRWSDGSQSSFRHWESVDKLTEHSEAENRTCAALNATGKWISDDCNQTKPFVCYEDKMVLINRRMNWVEALTYCREHHYSLVSITDHKEQEWAQEKAKQADTPFVWLGLRYTCALNFWFWVSDTSFTYQNWDEEEEADGCDMSAVMDSRPSHKWVKKSDDERFNFICSNF